MNEEFLRFLQDNNYLLVKRRGNSNSKEDDEDVRNRKSKATHRVHSFVDTHCHLNKLFQKEKFEGSFKEYMEQNEQLFPRAFDGCVSMFDSPKSYWDVDRYESLLGEEMVYGAFGCHPCNAHHYNIWTESILKERLKHEKVVALGEIGLDYYRDFPDRMIQKAVFGHQLKIAVERQLPIVVHSRDSEEDALNILKRHVPHDHLIHRHCYTGDWEQLQEWTSYFTNLYVGFTNVLTYLHNTQSQEVAAQVSLRRILLETDAPHFLPNNVPLTQDYEFSNPGMAIFVASKIAACRRETSGETFIDVLQAARENTLAVYGI